MYAIIQTGGKQYRVRKGDVVRIELLDSAAASGEVEFPEVFLVGNGREVAIGRPTVPGARVRATVLGADRLPKVLVFKKKKTKQYKRTIGHRQHVLAIRIDDIDSGGTVMPLEPQAKAAARPQAGARRKKTAPAKAKAAAPKGGASRARRKAASAGKAAPPASGAPGGKGAPAKPGATKSRAAKSGGRKPAGGGTGKSGSGRKRPSGGRG